MVKYTKKHAWVIFMQEAWEEKLLLNIIKARMPTFYGTQNKKLDRFCRESNTNTFFIF